MKKVLAYLCVLSAFFGYRSASAESPVFCSYKITCKANSDTYVSVPATRASEFNGVVEAVVSDGNKIVVRGEPNFENNRFVYSAGIQRNHYYLKFTSGELEGAWYDIKANDAYSVNIEIGAGELSKVASDDSFEIIPHWTFATLFPNGGGFTKSKTIFQGSGASRLYKYTLFGENGLEYSIGVNGEVKSSYFYHELNSDKAWKNGDRENVDDEVIEPNAVFIVRQPDNDASITYNGVIPMCATSFEVFTEFDGDGVPNQDVYLAVPSAVDIKLSDLTQCLVESGAFAASTGLFYSPEDVLYVFNNQSEGVNLSPDAACYYRKTSRENKWIDASRNDADNLVLKSCAAIILMKKSNGAAEAVRCKFKPNYIQQ